VVNFVNDSHESATSPRAKKNAWAFIALFGASVVLVYVWFGFNVVMTDVLGIPHEARSATVSHRESFAGALPYPTPWWVGALLVAGFAVLLASSWKRENQMHELNLNAKFIFRITPGMIALASVFVAIGCVTLGMYYTPDTLSPWYFLAAASVGVAAVSQARKVHQDRENRLPTAQRRNRG
jgi:hypothetical protein